MQGESVLATGSFDATAGIWRRYEADLDLCNGTEEYNDDEDEEWRFAVILDGHESEIKSVAWSAGGSFLATCSRDKSVWIWEEMDDDNFETIAVMQEHTQDVKCVTWHPEEALLASASYDDTIRLYREDIDDWVCCTVLTEHESTVWCVVFEPLTAKGYDENRSARLASCSGDKTVKIWTRVKQTGVAAGYGDGVPSSILRGAPVEEEWVCSATLPAIHERSIYSISWSPKTGRIASCGGDGKIVVYKENPNPDGGNLVGETSASGSKGQGGPWKVIAEIEGAHGVYEINSVAWSKRYDKDRKGEDDEIIVSAGDDGEVNIWEVVD